MKENGKSQYQQKIEIQPMNDFNFGAQQEPRFSTHLETVTVFVFEPGVFSRSDAHFDANNKVISGIMKGGEKNE